MLEAGGQRLTVVPEWDWAITEYLGVVASGHRRHGDFWFPQSVRKSSTLKDMQGGWATYRDEIRVTAVDTAAGIPEDAFSIPQPKPGDPVVVTYPQWRPRWEDEPVEVRKIISALGPNHHFVWSGELNEKDALMWQASLPWRDAGIVSRALDPRSESEHGHDKFPMPFVAPDGSRIIWAVYDAIAKRLKVVECPSRNSQVNMNLSFEKLKVTVRCNWYMEERRELNFMGDGKVVYRMITPENEEKYRAELMLSDGQREALGEALKVTQSLKLKPEEIMADDAVEFELELYRHGQSSSAKFIAPQEKAYQKLLSILRAVERQEYMVHQLTASTPEQRAQAERDIRNERSLRIKNPEREVPVHLKQINYRRLLAILRPRDMSKVAEKLQAAVGGDWIIAKRERAPGLGHEIWHSSSTWYGVSVPYVVLPFSSTDAAGKAKLRTFRERCNAALDVIAVDDRLTLLAGGSQESDVTSRILQTLNMRMSNEAKKRQRIAAQSHWLDFRLPVVNKAMFNRISRIGPKPQEKLPSKARIAGYRKLFAEKGPNGGQQRGDPYQWFWKMDMCNASTVYERVKSRHGVDYFLLSNKPEEVLLSSSARPRPWHLERVLTSEDKKGRISIVLELDETSTRRMQQMIKGREGWPLAVLFDNSIMALVNTADGLPDGQVVLTGGGEGFKTETAEKIVKSLSACMLRETAPKIANNTVTTNPSPLDETSTSPGVGHFSKDYRVVKLTPEIEAECVAAINRVGNRPFIGKGKPANTMEEALELLWKSYSIRHTDKPKPCIEYKGWFLVSTDGSLNWGRAIKKRTKEIYSW